MARRRRVPNGPTAAELAAADAACLERRYLWLGRFLLAAEPDSMAARRHALIRASRERLDASGKPVAERLIALETALAELGLLEAASRFADRFADRGAVGRTNGGRRHAR